MHAIDTNVLVRVITGDEPRQSERAMAVFRNSTVWIAKTVLLETEWVLRRLYEFDQASIAQAFERLLGLPNVRIEDSRAIRVAMNWYADGLDFADGLHLASRGDADIFVTFDKRFGKRARALTDLVIEIP